MNQNAKTQDRERIEVHVDRLEDAPAAVAEAHRARRGEKLPDDPDFLHMRLLGEDRARLKRILVMMLDAPDLTEDERIGFAGAARYAFRRCLENPPAHVKGAAEG